jgi:serralysin
MAILNYREPMQDYQWFEDLFRFQNFVSKSATSFVFNSSGDGRSFQVTLTGVGLTYGANTQGQGITGGKITGFSVTENGQVIADATGLNGDASYMIYALMGFDRGPNRGSENPDPSRFINHAFSGNDIVTGSAGNDDFWFAHSSGNDTISMLAGDDWLNADAGNDKIDGGLGWDVVSYEEAMWTQLPLKGGVTVNLAKGTALDPWGGKDKLKGIEGVMGTQFADSFVGDKLDNEFSGGRGADKFDGGLGNDKLLYHRDVRQGGYLGINANMLTGTVVDGFGNTDTIKNIERIVGTNAADTFAGDGNNNAFTGLSGVDIINAGAGNDFIVGGGGADNLTGGAGEDEFKFQKDYTDYDDNSYDMFSQFGDTITDFESGVDRITFNINDFGGAMTTDLNLVTSDGAMVGTQQHFIFEAATHKLWFDSDGTGSDAKILVATLSITNSLTTDDIGLFT